MAKPTKAAEASRRYSLGPDGKRTLELRWTDEGILIRVDGAELTRLPDENAVAAGVVLPLPGGGQVDIKLLRGLFQRELIVLQGGFPVRDSASHPDVRLTSVSNAIWFWAGVNILFGLATSIWAAPFQLGSVNGLAAVAVGAFLVPLGYSVRRRYSQVALLLATLLISFEFAAPLLVRPRPDAVPSGNSVLAVIFIVFWMWGITRQGMEAIRLHQRMTSG